MDAIPWKDIVLVFSLLVGAAGFGKPVFKALKARAQGVENEVTQQTGWLADLQKERAANALLLADKDGQIKSLTILLNEATKRLNAFKVWADEFDGPMPKFAKDSGYYDPARDPRRATPAPPPPAIALPPVSPPKPSAQKPRSSVHDPYQEHVKYMDSNWTPITLKD